MDTLKKISLTLEELSQKISELSPSTKEILSFDEAVTYLAVSRSYLYKLTSGGEIPHYKPSGKLIFFKRSEINAWIFKNRISTKEETVDTLMENFYNFNIKNNKI